MEMGDEGSPPNSTAPDVVITGDVVPGEDDVLSFNDFLFWMPMLVDTWWKILVCALVGVLIFTLCCYCFRCCYFFWDCCSDPYWGYCPCCRTSGCEYCCKISFCTNTGKKNKKHFSRRKRSIPEDEQTIIISEKMIPTISSEWKSGSKTKIDLGDVEDGKNSSRPPTSNGMLNSRETLPQYKEDSSIFHFLGLGRRKRSYALDSGITSANVSFDDAASCKSYKSILPKNDIELVAVQTSGRYPQKLQKTIQELSAPRVFPVKEEEEGDEGSPFMYSSTPVSLSLTRSTPTPFKSIRPPSHSLIPVKAVPESLNTTRTSSYNEDTGSLLEHDSVHLMLFGKETIL